jgi:ribosome-binding protein aMBF1 (putative translation factor)
LFDNLCATGSLARCGPSSSCLNLNKDSDTGVSSTPSIASKRQAQARYNSEEKESKKVKLTVAEGVNRVAEEIIQARLSRQELATRLETAI